MARLIENGYQALQKQTPAVANTLPKAGGLATMPSRLSSLEMCIDSITRQVDVLYVYLDKYSKVPALLKKYNNIIPYLPGEVPRPFGETEDWRGAGKFVGLLTTGDCIYYTFDDDIIYPDGYSKLLADSLATFRYGALVGVHGSIFRAPYKSFTKHRRIVHFCSSLKTDKVVDMIGSGTLAFRTSTFVPKFSKWTNFNLGLDLMVAIDAHRLGLPRVLVARPYGYLKAIAEEQEDSLWSKLCRDDKELSNVMRGNSQLWEHRVEFKLSAGHRFQQIVSWAYTESLRRSAWPFGPLD